MRLTKKKGEDVKVVKALSESIIRPLLRKIMAGEVTEEDIAKNNLTEQLRSWQFVLMHTSATYVEIFLPQVQK